MLYQENKTKKALRALMAELLFRDCTFFMIWKGQSINEHPTCILIYHDALLFLVSGGVACADSCNGAMRIV